MEVRIRTQPRIALAKRVGMSAGADPTVRPAPDHVVRGPRNMKGMQPFAFI
jgi:hypothetical protein